MRKSLQDALFAKYPSLFRRKDLTPEESCMGRGIECGDGWYAILDGLCEVVSIHGRQTGHSLIEFAQVKEKLAELRIYTDGKCEWCRGAIDFAERFSRHICEETGRPGVLMAGSGGLRTLAEDVGSAKKYRRYQPNAGVVFDEHPQPRESLPKGWRAIASALMTSAAYAMPDVVLRFGHADGELQVDCPSPTETISGAIACARVIAVQTNPETGAMHIPPPRDKDDCDHLYLS